jgi:hypothetical protein
MAAGLTDHIWSVCELLGYRIAPPPWTEPSKPGRSSQPPFGDEGEPANILSFVSERGFYVPSPFSDIVGEIKNRAYVGEQYVFGLSPGS